jgi:hypothetical protein
MDTDGTSTIDWEMQEGKGKSNNNSNSEMRGFFAALRMTSEEGGREWR